MVPRKKSKSISNVKYTSSIVGLFPRRTTRCRIIHNNSYPNSALWASLLILCWTLERAVRNWSWRPLTGVLKILKIVHKFLLPLISVNFWNQIFENSREYGNFETGVTPPPTWHQILKPIRMLVTIFITCISRYIPYLYTHKVWGKLKDTFDYCPIRPHPTCSVMFLLLNWFY